MKTSVAVIGSGFSGMAAAAVLAEKNVQVKLFEKNLTIGGRARTFGDSGFLFDMGPSWYWMPDVFEKYYNRFGYSTSDFYELKQLDPGFKIIYGQDYELEIPSNFDELCEIFENIEKGSASKLRKFMLDAEYKYKAGMETFVYKPSLSITEFINFEILSGITRLHLFSSFSSYIRKYFKDHRLLALLEFPVLFLGAMPKDTPALYSLMNYSGLKQGTWYPMGGFGKVVDAFKKIAEDKGVLFYTSCAATGFEVKDKKIQVIHTSKNSQEVNAVIGAADYHHIENKIIEKKYRTYDMPYWDKLIFAPSCLIFYIGVKGKINKLRHHNLFFDSNFSQHAYEIYKQKKWPSEPLFYVCCPSKTDESVAPPESENLFVLMPIATGLHDDESEREFYFEMLLSRIERYTGQKIKENIVVKHSYSVKDFNNDYNAYKGNAYGLANTLLQTAFLKPKLKSKKIENLFYAGQLTVPGPGVPPAIISGQVSANELLKYLKIK